MSMFENVCRTGLHTLKLQVLDHVVTDLERSATLEVLGGPSFELHNGRIKNAYWEIFHRIRTGMEDTVTGILQGISEGDGKDMMNPKVQIFSQMEKRCLDEARLV